MSFRWMEYLINVLISGLSAWVIVSTYSVVNKEIEIINGVETIRVVRNSKLIQHLIFLVLLGLLVSYANLSNILRNQAKKHFRKTILLSIGILLAGMLAAFCYDYTMRSAGILSLPTAIYLSIIVFYFTLSLAYGMGKRWIQAERRQSERDLENTRSELKVLRNQIQPHFLFNVLNNLLSMVDQNNNPKLAESFERLSALLRHVVEENIQERTSLQKEIIFIRNYVALQLLRFEADEVSCSISVHGDTEHILVEPGLFIPFVENAFKYGVEPEKKSDIDIHFDIMKEGILKFSCRNPVFPDMSANHGIGSGISSTRKRLELVYPDRHTLEIVQNGLFTVSLQITTDAGNYSG